MWQLWSPAGTTDNYLCMLPGVGQPVNRRHTSSQAGLQVPDISSLVPHLQQEWGHDAVAHLGSIISMPESARGLRDQRHVQVQVSHTGDRQQMHSRWTMGKWSLCQWQTSMRLQ